MGAAKKSTSKKRVAKGPQKQYDCDDVEAYLSRAIEEFKKEADNARKMTIEQVNSELLPRIDMIDKRDRDQYDTAKKIMVDLAAVATAKQSTVENQVSRVESEVQEILETRKELFGNINTQLEQLSEKLDTHIKNFSTVNETLLKTSNHVYEIQRTLDNVSANGNKGLSASFTDVYNKLTEMQRVTAGARAREKFWSDFGNVINTTSWLKPFRSKWGAVIYIALIVLIVNTVLHALGINFDIGSIFEWLFRIATGKGA